jgi:hypothetical protein
MLRALILVGVPLMVQVALSILKPAGPPLKPRAQSQYGVTQTEEVQMHPLVVATPGFILLLITKWKHVAALGHIILIPIQPVFVLTPCCCVRIEEAKHSYIKHVLVFLKCIATCFLPFL